MLPTTVWRTTSGNNENVFDGPNDIVDTAGNNLVDTLGNQIVDTGISMPIIPKTDWVENESE